MSRYLDFSTTGDQAAVAERCRHTLQRIGKVQDFDVSGRLTGTIPIEGWVARVIVTLIICVYVEHLGIGIAL